MRLQLSLCALVALWSWDAMAGEPVDDGASSTATAISRVSAANFSSMIRASEPAALASARHGATKSTGGAPDHACIWYMRQAALLSKTLRSPLRMQR